MKRILIFVSLITFSLFSFAKGEKVIERSAKHTPDWVFGMEKGYIITAAEGSSMEMARSRAMQQVKERIISSVAEHIESETASQSSEIVTDDDISAMSIFVKQIKTKSANIPFLNNISEAHVEDYYWEKIELEKGKYSYVYNIKYPFSDLQIRQIIREFKEREAALNERLTAFESVDLGQLGSVEAMLDNMSQLQVFQQSLPEGDSRIQRCVTLNSRYKKMLAEIEIRFDKVSKRSAQYHLYYGTTMLSYSKKPQLSSNCLTQLQWMPLDDGGLVEYNFEQGCYEDENNYLIVTYKLNGVKITNQTIVR